MAQKRCLIVWADGFKAVSKCRGVAWDDEWGFISRQTSPVSFGVRPGIRGFRDHLIGGQFPSYEPRNRETEVPQKQLMSHLSCGVDGAMLQREEPPVILSSSAGSMKARFSLRCGGRE